MLIALSKKGQHNATTNPRTRRKTDEVIFLPGCITSLSKPYRRYTTTIMYRSEEKGKEMGGGRTEGEKSARESEREKEEGTRFEYKPRFRSRVPRYA